MNSIEYFPHILEIHSEFHQYHKSFLTWDLKDRFDLFPVDIRWNGSIWSYKIFVYFLNKIFNLTLKNVIFGIYSVLSDWAKMRFECIINVANINKHFRVIFGIKNDIPVGVTVSSIKRLHNCIHGYKIYYQCTTSRQTYNLLKAVSIW